MAARQCPQCQNRLSAFAVAAYSDALECPNCGAKLEVSAAPRYISASVGLVAAALAVWWIGVPERSLGWTVPTLAAFFAFSLVTPIVLIAVADLVGRQEIPAEPVENAAADHGAAHGGHH